MTNALFIIVTAYCHCATCCGESGQRTASGKWPKAGRTIAAPRSIPFGTRLNIEGIGTRTVEDRLALRFDDRFDVFVATHAEAQKFGRKILKATKL